MQPTYILQYIWCSWLPTDLVIQYQILYSNTSKLKSVFISRRIFLANHTKYSNSLTNSLVLLTAQRHLLCYNENNVYFSNMLSNKSMVRIKVKNLLHSGMCALREQTIAGQILRACASRRTAMFAEIFSKFFSLCPFYPPRLKWNHTSKIV